MSQGRKTKEKGIVKNKINAATELESRHLPFEILTIRVLAYVRKSNNFPKQRLSHKCGQKQTAVLVFFGRQFLPAEPAYFSPPQIRAGEGKKQKIKSRL